LLAFLSIFVSLLYLGLAILARGGATEFFAQPALTAVAGTTLALAVAAIFTQGNLSRGEREDRGNRWVLWAFGVIGTVDGILPAYSDRIDFWTMGSDGVRWLGVGLYAAGGILRLWPVFVLGRRFSGLVAIQPGHTLVTTGLYAAIRNPSYLGLLVNMTGWALAFRSVAGVILVALMLPPLVARMKSGEAMLEGQFGEPYRAYRARTWRLLPGIY